MGKIIFSRRLNIVAQFLLASNLLRCIQTDAFLLAPSLQPNPVVHDSPPFSSTVSRDLCSRLSKYDNFEEEQQLVDDSDENEEKQQQQPGPKFKIKGLTSKIKSASHSVRSSISSKARDVSTNASSNLQSVAGTAWSGATNASSNLQSVAGTAWSGVSKAASRGGSDVQSVAGTAWSGVSKVASRGGSDVQSVAGTAWSGVSKVASRGGSDVQSAARTARTGLTGIASRVGSVAGSASSTVVGAVRQGGSDTAAVLQWLDGQAKDGVSTTNAKAKDIVLQFTGKSEYVFGDIAKELIQRASSTDVSIQDLMLLLKILLTIGASITPLAKLLPLTVLLDMLNVSIEARIGGKLIEVLAESLDDRFKAAFTAEELGGLAKRSLSLGISSFTGKDRYEDGDIERAVVQMEEKQQQQDDDYAKSSVATQSNVGASSYQIIQQATQPQPTTTGKILDLRLGPEFEAWDTTFRDSHPGDWESAIENSLSEADQETGGSRSSSSSINSRDLDMEIVSELEEWDQRFEKLNSGA